MPDPLDYSSMSNEQLAALAGVQLPTATPTPDTTPAGYIPDPATTYGPARAELTPTDVRVQGTAASLAPDYSTMSNEALAKLAGIELPRTWSETAVDASKSYLQGVSGVANLASTVKDAMEMRPLQNVLANALGVKLDPTAGQQIESLRQQYIGDPEFRNAGLGERMASKAFGATPYALLGGGVVSAASSGAGGELSKSLGLPEWLGQLVGGAAPGLARSGAGKIVNAIGGDDYLKTANNLEQQALGARYNDYLKSAKNDFIDPTLPSDDVETALRKNIQEVVDSGTFKGVEKDPKSLWKANATETSDTGKQVADAIKDVDAGLNGLKIYPKKSAFKNAEDYIKRASVTEDDDLAEYLDKFVNKLKQKSDGSVEFLQKEKRALQSKVYAGKDQGKEIIDKYIASDIRRLIEETSDKVLGKDKANLIKDLNHKLETHLDLDTILRRTLAKDEGASGASAAIQAERTSGGTLTGPTLKGIAFGSSAGTVAGAPFGMAPLGAGIGGALGGAAGLGYGKTLGYLASQEGKFATADTLRALAPLKERYGALVDVIAGKGLVSSAVQSGLMGAQTSRQKNPEGAQSLSLGQQGLEQKSLEKSSLQNQLSLDSSNQKSSSPYQERGLASQQDQVGSEKKSGATSKNSGQSSSSNDELTPLPKQLKSEVKALISQQPKYVQAVIHVESAGNSAARSSKGAQGLMQLMPETAKELGVNPKDPKQNIEGGTRYLKQLMKKYDDSRLAYAAYNSGPGRVDRAIKLAKIKDLPPTWTNIKQYLPRETQNYVPRVLSAYSKLTEV